MYWADRHVEGMLFNLKEHSVIKDVSGDEIYEYRIEYRIPHHTPGMFTRICGFWIGDRPRFFVLSWENDFVVREEDTNVPS